MEAPLTSAYRIAWIIGAVAVITAVDIDLVIVVVEIPAVHVVHIAVAVVDAIAGDLVLVDPDSVGQVLAGIVHTGVNQGDQHIPAAAVIDRPCFLRTPLLCMYKSSYTQSVIRPQDRANDLGQPGENKMGFLNGSWLNAGSLFFTSGAV